MNFKEAAKELNREFKSEQEKTLLNRIDELEKIIENLAQRIEYLEANVH